MSVFTGTGKLFRAAFRRDRIKLPVWILGIGAILIPSTLSVKALYDTPEEIIGYVSASALSVAARAFNGPVLGATQESIMLTETFTFFTLFVAFMSTLLVIRHTRAEEESGRTELIGSAAVGLYAPLASALCLALVANLLIVGTVTFAYMICGLALGSSLLAGAAMGLMGMVFAGIAAVAAQLTQTSRAANAIAGGSVGLFFLLRAIGDAFGEVQPGGTEVKSGLATMFSPMGLAREVQPFVRDNVWPLVVLGLVVGALVAAALLLRSRRDLGSGLFPARRGPAVAATNLSNAFGLALRQQKGLIVGWFIGLIVLSIALGSMAQEVAKITASSKDMAEAIALLGGSKNLTEAYLAYSMSLFGVMAVGYAIQAMQKVRSEESEGRLELILAGGVRRQAWLISHMLITVIGGAILVTAAGLAAGITHGMLTNDLGGQAFILLQAGMVQIPVVLLFISLVALLFAVVPSISSALSWSFFAGSYAVMQLGALLKLPQWVIDLSPFTHVPALPAEDLTWSSLVWMSIITLVVTVIAIAAFRRRDVTTT